MQTKIDLIMLGVSGVGKTAVLNRFRLGKFLNLRKETIQAEFFSKVVYIENREITLFLWDMPGQGRFRYLVKSYYRKADGVLLVYDVTDSQSFYELSGWLKELRNVNEDAFVLITGNKIDDRDKRQVNISVVKQFAEQEKLDYMEISALTGENVEEAFDHLIRKIMTARGIIGSKVKFIREGFSDSPKVIPEDEGDTISLCPYIPLDSQVKSDEKKQKKCCSKG